MKKRLIFLLCAVFLLAGCSTNAEAEPLNDAEEKEEIAYTSNIEKEACALCNQQGNTLLPLYAGEQNLGIICLNTFDISPIEINRYDDYGNLIEESAGSMRMTHNGFGEDGMSTSVSANSDRGYANADVSFEKDKQINKIAVENLLCQDCLTAIMEESWDEPYGVGLINFDTLEIRLFEENLLGFSFGDYYIDIDRRETDDETDRIELDLLVFYCPPRYD